MWGTFSSSLEEESALSRWIRELRGGVHDNESKVENKVQGKSATLDRSNPIYHSEGKGLRARRAAKDKRRHSFNQRPQQQHQQQQNRHWAFNSE
ncbi:hypothetical protein O3M35_001719 [Rhynocoris fuscipes]|uniref:Uncharacterized protein n=1 Tax=Rhynocoris fuscipes TaxID=488301 RepID=A0AAW1CPL7_9HEMI